ncbi:alpha/beta fold hydrolase [Nannocystaceae bacterium ST9]
MQLRRDDVALGYEDAGAGDPPLLLIHGWATDRRLFAPLIHATSPSHRVVAVDLRGHGESDATIHEASVEAYADDVAWIAAQLGLVRPVVIGHSMGGLVALEFASRFDARAAVILESPVAAPPAMAAAIQPAIDRLETDAYRDTAGNVMRMLIGEQFGDLATRARMIDDARALPQHVLARSLRASVAYASRPAAARVRCPILYVGTGARYADLAAFKEVCPQLVIGQLVGCGHYFPIEVPEQLNPMILRFLAIHVAAAHE